MQRPIGSQTLTTLQIVGALGVLVGAVALWTGADRLDDRFYLIHQGPQDYWITAPQSEARLKAIPVPRANPPLFRFKKFVDLNEIPEHAPIRVWGLREISLFANDEAVPLDRSPARWKQPAVVDLAPFLRPGRNVITAELKNADGPVLLRIGSDVLPVLATTGRGWSIERSGRPGQLAAVVAKDVRKFPGRDTLPVPREALRAQAVPLTFVFLLCAAAVGIGLRLPRWLRGANLPRTALAIVATFWLTLFFTKSVRLPTHVGFDSAGHLDYVEALTQEARLPGPDEGWEAFQPPLYYAATAGLRRLTDVTPGTPADRGVLRLLPMLSGLAAAAIAGLTARRLVPQVPGVAAVATLAAGLLPMHVLLSTFISNEPVNTLFASAALFVACKILCAPRAAPRTMAALAILLGLATLTKSTSLPLAALLPAVVATKLWLVEARPGARSLGTLAALWASVLALSGWFYLRNWVAVGDPFVTNLTAYSQWGYWIPPGFHTTEWFLGFGEVFSQPYFSSFHSFADGLYSAFWGDGYASGANGVNYPNPWWDYEAMAAVYPLAVPATLILAYGLVRVAAEALRGEDSGRRLALSTLCLVAVAMFASLLLGSARYPFNGMPKTFYALPALVPLALAFAMGVEGLRNLGSGIGQRLIRSGLAGYGGALATSIVVAFLR